MNHNKANTLESINPPAGLSLKIVRAVEAQARHSAKMRFGLLSSLSIASLSSCVYFFVTLWKSFLYSGFYEYFSLAITDTSTLGVFWKELLVSLAESVPALTLAMFLAVSGVFIWSGAKTFRTASILKVI